MRARFWGQRSFIERSRLGAARSWLRICKAERGPQPCHPCAGLRYWSSPAKCAPDRWPHGPAARTRAWLWVVDIWRHLAAAMPRFKGAGGAWSACAGLSAQRAGSGGGIITAWAGYPSAVIGRRMYKRQVAHHAAGAAAAWPQPG